MDRRYQTTITKKQLSLLGALLLTMICAAPASAEVELKSKGMTVYGQSELPKVLYIVPWKRKDTSSLDMPQTGSLMADILDPINPSIFRRRIRYHKLMTQQSLQNDQ
jgi:hypothetical protein